MGRDWTPCGSPGGLLTAAAAPSSGTPSGYSGFAQTSEGTVGGTRTASGWRQANTATEDPGAVTGTSTTARAFTIAIKPVGFPDAGIATGTGAAAAVFANVAPNAEVATGTGQAQDPVVSLDALTYAQPPTITGTGTANNARPHVLVNAGLASGTGTAHDATGTTLAQVTRTGGTSSIFASDQPTHRRWLLRCPLGTNYLVAMVSTFSSVTDHLDDMEARQRQRWGRSGDVTDRHVWDGLHRGRDRPHLGAGEPHRHRHSARWSSTL